MQKAHGAKVVNENGGAVLNTFFYPAVLYPVNEKMKVYSEEQFGPIVPIVPFDTDDEPIHYVMKFTLWSAAQYFWKRFQADQQTDRFICQPGRSY